MLEATARAVQAETKSAEGATQSSTWLPLLCLWLQLGAGSRWCLLFTNIRRLHAAADISALDMQEVTAVAEGTNPKGAEGAAGEVPPAAESRALLGGIVDKEATAAIVAVASGVVAATQLSLILGVAEGNM